MKKEERVDIYKNAPLFEAIFEIRFPPELSIECQRDQYYEKIREEYPKIFVPKILSAQAPSLRSYQFKTENEKKLIRFCINSFSYHMYKEAYNENGFQGFSKECLKWMNSFCELYKISTLKRTGLRYINHIPIIREADNTIPINRYINFKYNLPSSIPQKFNLFQMGLTVQKGKGKLNTLIGYKKLQDPQETEIIVLDFDYYFEKNFKAKQLENYLNNSHTHTKEIFWDLITKEYKKVMKGENK